MFMILPLCLDRGICGSGYRVWANTILLFTEDGIKVCGTSHIRFCNEKKKINGYTGHKSNYYLCR